MSNLKKETGITLIALVITVIVILMLAGIAISIAYQSILNKAESAVNITIEEMLRERVEMALVNCEISKLSNSIYNNRSFDEEEFKTELQSMIEVENIIFEGNILKFTYKKDEYKFNISQEKDVAVIYNLKDNIRIGDYFEYPIEYEDVYTDRIYNSTNGWVVIDDGVTEGTSGIIKLISKGVPAKWYCDTSTAATNAEAVNKLNNNFGETLLLGNKGKSFYGSEFKCDFANRVKTISLQELNFAYNIINNQSREINDTSRLNKIDNIFYLEDANAYYWLANNIINDSKAYFVNNGEILKESDLRMGIRVVVELKNDLSAIFESGVWRVIE